MKRFLCLVLAMMLLPLASALCEGFILPTDVPQGSTGEEGGFLLPTPVPDTLAPLPNPGIELGVNAENNLPNAEYLNEEYVFLEYRAAIGQALSDYLERCRNAGYTVEPTKKDLPGYDAFAISGGGLTAFLVPDYQSRVLWMVPVRMDVESGQHKEFEDGTVWFTLNGTTYRVKGPQFSSDSNQYSVKGSKLSRLVWAMFSENNISFSVAIPKTAKLGDTFTANRDENPDNIILMITDQNNFRNSIDGQSRNYVEYDHSTNSFSHLRPQDRLTGADDYFTITVVDRTNDCLMCKFEGVFDNGDTVISGTFKHCPIQQ